MVPRQILLIETLNLKFFPNNILKFICYVTEKRSSFQRPTIESCLGRYGRTRLYQSWKGLNICVVTNELCSNRGILRCG